MNTLSSLPPPSFGDLSLRGATPAVDGTSPTSGALELEHSGQPLHVSADATLRSVDDIERDFLAALCENRSA